jgi:hypothetical protein
VGKQPVGLVVLWFLLPRSTDGRIHRPPLPVPDPEAEHLVFYETQASIQRGVVYRILGIVLLGIGVLLLLQFLGNGRAVDTQGIHWERFDWQAGINAADATVIVLGLLTVAAAISIALVTAVPRGEPARPDDSFFIGRLVWSEWTGNALMLSSALALATALTQYFAVGREIRAVQVGLLTFIALLSTALTAGVSGWATEALSQARSRATISRLEAVLMAPGVVFRPAEGWKTRQYAYFVLGIALTATIFIVLPQYIWHPAGLVVNQPYSGCSPVSLPLLWLYSLLRCLP